MCNGVDLVEGKWGESKEAQGVGMLGVEMVESGLMHKFTAQNSPGISK